MPRDDTDRLRKVAELAASFYGEERARLTLPLAGLVDVHPLGTFIKTVVTNTTPPGLATRQVHSVVTQRSWQFGEDQRTTIQTGHMELDVRKSP